MGVATVERWDPPHQRPRLFGNRAPNVKFTNLMVFVPPNQKAWIHRWVHSPSENPGYARGTVIKVVSVSNFQDRMPRCYSGLSHYI